MIAEPRRREIIGLIWDKEMAASDIAARFDVTFGAVSQHLAVLRGAKLVSVRKEGNRRLYRADQDALAPYKAILESMWTDTLRGLAEAIHANEGTK